ncbi:hypothetical protein HDU96_009869, partial [Phlyctochytrium bullatum]
MGKKSSEGAKKPGPQKGATYKPRKRKKAPRQSSTSDDPQERTRLRRTVSDDSDREVPAPRSVPATSGARLAPIFTAASRRGKGNAANPRVSCRPNDDSDLEDDEDSSDNEDDASSDDLDRRLDTLLDDYDVFVDFEISGEPSGEQDGGDEVEESLPRSPSMSPVPHLSSSRPGEDLFSGSEDDSDGTLEQEDEHSEAARNRQRKRQQRQGVLDQNEDIHDYLREVEKAIRAKDGKPDCYMQNSFWIQAPNPAMHRIATGNPSNPVVSYYPDLFLWAPHHLLPRGTLKCRHSYFCPGCKTTTYGSQADVLEGLPTEKIEPFSEFAERPGYGGYIPSARYFRDVFAQLVDEQAPIFKKWLRMLPLRICRVDLSHKLPKKLATVNGVKLYDAVFSIFNEYEEVPAMALVPSKSHVHWRPLLEDIEKSLREFGLEQPQVVYTDNPESDAGLLLEIFPSLASNLAPAPSPTQPMQPESNLEELNVDRIEVQVTDRVATIKQVLDGFFARATVEGEVRVGLDAEWTVTYTARDHK